MFVLSIAELGFTVDSFQYLQKTHTWASKSERARLAFLIFSSVRTIFLAAVYMGFHCAQKYFHSMFHTVRRPAISSQRSPLFPPNFPMVGALLECRVLKKTDLRRSLDNLLDSLRRPDSPNVGCDNLQPGRRPYQGRFDGMPRAEDH